MTGAAVTVWQDAGEVETPAFVLASWFICLRPWILAIRTEIGDEEEGREHQRDVFVALLKEGDALVEARERMLQILSGDGNPAAPPEFAAAVRRFLVPVSEVGKLFSFDRAAARRDARALDRGAALLFAGKAIVTGRGLYRAIVRVRRPAPRAPVDQPFAKNAA